MPDTIRQRYRAIPPSRQVVLGTYDMENLTFVDGRETPVDLGKLSVKDTFAQIELETGRLDLEAMRRGKPWL